MASRFLLVGVVVLASLAGCLGDDAAVDDTTVETPPVTPTYDLPETVTAAGRLPVAFQWNCIEECPRVPFEVFGNTTVTAHLTWANPVVENDNDMFIYVGGSVVAEGIEVAPDETIIVDLPAGEYEVEIVPYRSTPEDYNLEITFAFPEVEDEADEEEMDDEPEAQATIKG